MTFIVHILSLIISYNIFLVYLRRWDLVLSGMNNDPEVLAVSEWSHFPFFSEPLNFWETVVNIAVCGGRREGSIKTFAQRMPAGLQLNVCILDVRALWSYTGDLLKISLVLGGY